MRKAKSLASLTTIRNKYIIAVEKSIRISMKRMEIKMDNNNYTPGIFSGQNIQENAEQINYGEMPSEPKKKGVASKIFGGIVLSFVIMLLFIGLQVIISMAAMIWEIVKAALENPNDAAYIEQAANNILSDANFMTTLTLAATAISAVFSVFFYWLIYGRKRTPQDKAYFKEKVLTGKNFAMISIATVGLYYLSLVIVAIISVISPSLMESYNELIETSLGGSMILVMLATVILAPINEECIMRGLILRNLQKYFSVSVVIVIQAIMFGIFHMNWVQGIYVLPIGAALGFVAIKSRSVLPSIYMHLFYNLMSFVIDILPAVFRTFTSCVAMIIICAAAVWAIQNHRGDEQDDF